MDEVDFTPPEIVARNAARGLEWRERFGRGGTEVGVARATDLAARREQTPQTIRRMVSYFSRHEVDKRGRNFFNDDNPSAGRIAWLLWGGDEARAWALDIKSRIGKGEDV